MLFIILGPDAYFPNVIIWDFEVEILKCYKIDKNRRKFKNIAFLYYLCICLWSPPTKFVWFWVWRNLVAYLYGMPQGGRWGDRDSYLKTHALYTATHTLYCLLTKPFILQQKSCESGSETCLREKMESNRLW